MESIPRSMTTAEIKDAIYEECRAFQSSYCHGDSSDNDHMFAVRVMRLLESTNPRRDFSWALAQTKVGLFVQRDRWNGTKKVGLFGSASPCLCAVIADGTQLRWTPDQQDMLATDWRLA